MSLGSECPTEELVPLSLRSTDADLVLMVVGLISCATSAGVSCCVGNNVRDTTSQER